MSDRVRWVDRKVISFEQAERMDGEPSPEKVGGPRTVEVLGYVGAIALLIATIAAVIEVMVPENAFFAFISGNLDTVQGGLVALVGAAIIFGTGYRFAEGAGAIRRASGFMLFVGYGLANIAFTLLLFDLDIGDFTQIVVIIPSVVVAVVAWRRLRSVPTQFALFGAASGLLSAVLVLAQLEDPIEVTNVLISAMLGGTVDAGGWISLLANVALGLAWIWLTRSGTIMPRNAGFLIGSLYAWFFALSLFGTADGWIVLSAMLVIAYLWAATQWHTTILAAVGGVGTIILILQLMTVIYEEGPDAVDFLLWYGVPGALAMAGIWLFAARRAPSAPAASPMPAPGSDPTV